MLDMPMLKFEKSTKFLENQLQVQQNNKQLISNIISNIGLILNKESIKDENKLKSALDSANLFLQTITSNIITIEQLDLEIKNITKELSELVSDKNKPSKTKEFYIASFTSIKQNIVIYSKKIRDLEDKLSKDNAEFNNFITDNNIQFNFETVSSSDEEDSDSYKFTGFSLDEDNTTDEVEEILPESIEDTIPEPIEDTISEPIEDTPSESTDGATVSLEESEDEVTSNFDYSDLIADIIEEATDVKPNYLENYSDDFEGFDIENIMTQFNLTNIEQKNIEETSIVESIADEEVLDESKITIDESDISEDMDSLLDLLTDEDFEEINEDVSTNNAIEVPTEDNFEDNNLEDSFASLENSFKSFDDVLKSSIENTVSKDANEDIYLTLEDFSNMDFDETSVIVEDIFENDTTTSVEKETFDDVVTPVEGNNINEIIPSVEDIASPIEETVIEENDVVSDEEENHIYENILSEKNNNIFEESNITSEKDNNIFEDEEDNILITENKKRDPEDNYANKIAKIEQGNLDNETLLISERTKKIYLPYKTSELLDYIHSYPNLYTSLSDVVKQEFILPFTYFSANPKKSRFSETYSLMRNREGKGFFSSTSYALKISKNKSLNPAIIASCKTKDELESYLDCLNNNKLDKFKTFNIDYEINPV